MSRSPRFSLKPQLPGEVKLVDRPLFVGTEADCDLVLPSGPGVGHPSRRHALLSPEADCVWLEDLGSRNGTFLNDKKLEKGIRTRLRSGDRVRFAKQDWEFLDSAGMPDWVDPEKREVGGSDTDLIDDKARERLAAGGQNGVPESEVETPCLEVLSGAAAGTLVTLNAADSGRSDWQIGGAAESNALVLEDDGVSQEHAKITCEAGRWAVRDLLSKNGTFVNGTRTRLSYLRSGDKISIGPVVCMFRLPGSRSAPRFDRTLTDIPPLTLSRWEALAARLKHFLAPRGRRKA
jgi:pSer/pThr/pTyr-binding forkhead associated (FHA) protein